LGVLVVGGIIVLVLGAFVAALIATLGIGNEGLRATKPPWPPEYEHLHQRLQALDLPPVGEQSYHVHALLHLYVEGQALRVPANIGIYPPEGIEASLHTHDTSGVIHMEAIHPYPYTLGDFFEVWGVRFSSSELGAYTNSGSERVQVYVNGHLISDPTTYVLKEHDNIVVGYGEEGSFPKDPSAAALEGL
jgi:hypothetical protein